jgi:putative ABC transport system permease protein
MTHFLNWLSQIVVITKFSLQSLPERKGASAAAVFGIAGVVAVLVGVLSIAQGFRRAMTVCGSPDTAIVLRGGADAEMSSFMSKETTRVIADSPGILRSADGPEASAELFVIIDLPKRSTGTDANVPLRGVESAAYKVRGELQIRAGRRFEPGRNEVIVGVGALNEFAGLDLGSKIKVGGDQWTIVGIFSANGGLSESEIWADASVLQASYKRGSSFQSVFVKLTSAEGFQAFKETLTDDPRLNVKVIRETDYYVEQSRMVFNLITGLGTLVAGLMGIGAVFGALNTMYSAVAARTREIATLRALGFGSGPVVISVLLESLALALLGGLLGGGLAYFLFDGYRAATMNWQSFSQVAFSFAVTPSLLVQGAIYATIIGFFGGLFPAIRASRLQIATALREL